MQVVVTDAPKSVKDSIEVVKTYTGSQYTADRARVNYSYVYRCVDCNRFWTHHKDAVVHNCAKVTVMGVPALTH